MRDLLATVLGSFEGIIQAYIYICDAAIIIIEVLLESQLLSFPHEAIGEVILGE